MSKTTGTYKFFENKSCSFFPCHSYPQKNFNCLFCYCPLYLIKDCGGNFETIELDTCNIKDCSKCYLPHKEENYDYIIKKLYTHNNS